MEDDEASGRIITDINININTDINTDINIEDKCNSTSNIILDNSSCIYIDNLEEQEFKNNKNNIKAKPWYKNWVVEDEDDEDDNNKGKTLKNQNKSKKRSDGIRKIVNQYCSNWEDSPSDIAIFFLCLSTLLKPKIDKKDKVFNEKLMINAYHYAEYAFAAYKGSKKDVLKELGFLKEKNYIMGNWNKNELNLAPAWFIAVDRDQKSIVLALRGTKGTDDIFVDLCAQYTKWQGGYVHQGFLKALKHLEPIVLPIIQKQLETKKGYKLCIVGHSMGAGVASLLTLKWTKNYPQWNIHGYGFATPCVISHHLVKESKNCFTTFVHHFDAVARISMGSIEDLHNAMRLFVKKLKITFNNSLSILRTLNYAVCATNKKIKNIINDIDEEISTQLLSLKEEEEEVTHLFPTGNTYQLWRENRGGNFKAWQMYKSSWLDYGRIYFAASMLKDHGSGSYKSAFENMLSINVTERKIWQDLPISRKVLVKKYWNSYPKGELSDPNFDISIPIDNMNKSSEYKQKAFDKGLIRPFLFLVSMSPLRRAAIAYLLGINIAPAFWYIYFDAHYEAYYILKSSSKSILARGNTTQRNLIPLLKDCNWYMILYNCGNKIIKGQGKYLPKDIIKLITNSNKSYNETIKHCKTPNNKLINEMEEIIMLLFYSLTDVDIAKTEVLQPIKVSDEELLKTSSYLDNIELLKSQGFTHSAFISKYALQKMQESSSKRANEVYSWGASLRAKDEQTRKRALEVVGVLGVAGFISILTLPLFVAAPPVSIIPIGLAIGIGGLVTKVPMHGALIAIIAGCLQQRILLASRNIYIDDYFPIKKKGKE